MEPSSQPPKKWTPDAIAGIFLIVLFAGIAVFVFFIGNQETTQARIYFDNGLEQTIRAQYDGVVVATATAHSAVEEWLPVGTHTIRILGEKDDVIEETPIVIPAAKGTVARQWVYNVSTANEYIMRFIPFGNVTPEEPKALGTGQRYFELPNNSPVFAPEGGIPIKGRAGTNMVLVIHAKQHPTGKCCQSLRDFIDYAERTSKPK